MFDAYTFPTHRVTERTEVHEHRAPTDKSVALLKKLEDEAKEKVLSINRLENNDVKAQWSVWDDPMRQMLKAIVQIQINGRELRVELDLGRPYERRVALDKVIHGVCDALSRDLMEQLFHQEPKVVETLMR